MSQTPRPIIQIALDFCRKDIEKFDEISKKHYQQAEIWGNFNLILVIITVFFSTLSVALIFLDAEPWVQIVSVIAAILTAISPSVNASGREVERRELGKKYEEYISELEIFQITVYSCQNDQEILNRVKDLETRRRKLVNETSKYRL